jgi:tyrosyl-tRNA synthetase
VYKFYQFWINTDDEGVDGYLKVYTTLDKPTIDDIMEAHNEARSNRLAQKRLAYEVTSIVNGNDRAESIAKLSEVLFGGGDYTDLNKADFGELKTELPFTQVKAGDSLIDVLVELELASSKSEARRFLAGNAIYINGSQIPLEKSTIDSDDSIEGHCIIRRGKNANVLIELDD